MEEAMLEYVQRRTFLTNKYPISEPFLQSGGGTSVSVVLERIEGEFLTQFQPDYIVLASVIIKLLLLGRDDIIGGADN
jgi:hypothetical protein